MPSRMRFWRGPLVVPIISCLLYGSTLTASPPRNPFRKGGKKSQVVQCIQSKAWPAYLVDKEGEPLPVRDTINTDQDLEWLGLRYTAYEGPKLRLGVIKVENHSARFAADESNKRTEVPVAGIEELVTVALFNTGRFDVIERKKINLVLREQGRKEAVEPSPKQLFEAGQVLGIQYLVYGTVNEWVPDRSTKKGGMARFRGGKQEAEVAINFTLTDIANAKIHFTTIERAKVGEWALQISTEEGAKGSTEVRTPINYAVQACVNKAAFRIMQWLQDQAWKGAVVSIKGSDLYINAGTDQGLRPGVRLSLFRRKGPVFDRNIYLGEDLAANGTLKVFQAQPGFSIARVEEGGKGVKLYDRVELTQPLAKAAMPAECQALLPPIGI